MMTVDVENDPATPALRLALTRELLIGSIRRYEETLAATRALAFAYPNLREPRAPQTDEELGERYAWRRLIKEADQEFDAAELALACRIEALYESLESPGRATDPDFVEMAIRHKGRTYVLNYGTNNYYPETNIVAVVVDDLVVDLGYPPYLG